MSTVNLIYINQKKNHYEVHELDWSEVTPDFRARQTKKGFILSSVNGVPAKEYFQSNYSLRKVA